MNNFFFFIFNQCGPMAQRNFFKVNKYMLNKKNATNDKIIEIENRSLENHRFHQISIPIKM